MPKIYVVMHEYTHHDDGNYDRDIVAVFRRKWSAEKEASRPDPDDHPGSGLHYSRYVLEMDLQ